MDVSSGKRRDLLFLVLMTLCFKMRSNAQVPAYNEIPVGVILDMGSWLGKTVHSCITMAVSDFYTLYSNYTTRIVIHNRDTHGEPLHALSTVIESMHGVVGLKSYIPQSRDLNKFISKWRKDYELKDINVYAIAIYDAVSALAMAVERTQDLTMTGPAQWRTELLNQMLRISFDGLGGAFQFMNQRVSAQVLEIINVIGKGERRVGFWTKDAAFTKNFGKMNSFFDDGLEAIMWPGGIQTNPTQRMLQVRSKLRIGIPVNHRSIGGLFQVQTDAHTNKPVVSGAEHGRSKTDPDRKTGPARHKPERIEG
nr:extracellular ligand-binding receptor [Tanacetum cinerariifolium]